MGNLIAVVIILAILVPVIGYILYKSKKKGVKCIGCPYAPQCSSHSSCSREKTKFSPKDHTAPKS